MKNGNLYQKLKTAKRELAIAESNRKDVERAMEAEIKAIKEKYKPALAPLIQKEDIKYSKVWHLGKDYHRYGSFNTNVLRFCVATLMTYIEGERYVPYSTTEALKNGVILKEHVALEFDNMDERHLLNFIMNGNAALLGQEFSTRCDLFDYTGKPNYMIGRFEYLREFFRRLVEYRVENGLEEIATDDMFKFMSMFLRKHPELTLANKDRRDRMLMGNTGEINDCFFLPELIEQDDDLSRGCATLERMRIRKDE